MYDGGYPDGKISDKKPKIPTKDEDKFNKLTHIKVAFDYIDKDHRLYSKRLLSENRDKRWLRLYNYGIEDDAILGNFKNYLTAKCPRLNKPIVIQQARTGIRALSFVFESK